MCSSSHWLFFWRFSHWLSFWRSSRWLSTAATATATKNKKIWADSNKLGLFLRKCCFRALKLEKPKTLDQFLEFLICRGGVYVCGISIHYHMYVAGNGDLEIY